MLPAAVKADLLADLERCAGNTRTTHARAPRKPMTAPHATQEVMAKRTSRWRPSRIDTS
jgi:hypothetical protein